MKKMFLAFGLLGIVGSLIPLGLASPYGYHLQNYPYFKQYYPQLRTYRPFSNRIGPIRAQSYTQSKSIKCYRGEPCYELAVQSQRQRHSAQSTRRPINNASIAQIEAARKAQAQTSNPRYPNTYQSQRLYIRNGNYVERGIEYENYQASQNNQRPNLQVQRPTDIDLNLLNFKEDQNGIFRSPNTTLAFRITETPEGYNCNENGFTNCVQRLSQNFQKSLSGQQIYNFAQKFRWNQTKDQNFAYFPTLSEKFKTSKKHQYYVFNALNPATGKIIRIEAVAQASDRSTAPRAMYAITESFRFKN